MCVVDGQHRGLLKDIEDFDASVIGTHHKLLHVVSECKPVDLTI